jgi:hypothetical protein
LHNYLTFMTSQIQVRHKKPLFDIEKCMVKKFSWLINECGVNYFWHSFMRLIIQVLSCILLRMILLLKLPLTPRGGNIWTSSLLFLAPRGGCNHPQLRPPPCLNMWWLATPCGQQGWLATLTFLNIKNKFLIILFIFYFLFFKIK